MLLSNESSNSKFIINGIVLVLSIIGIARREYDIGKYSTFENLMIDSVAPVQRTITFFKNEVQNFSTLYLSIVNANKENVALKKQVQSLEKTIFENQEIIRENSRLRDLLNFGSGIVNYEKVVAQVVAWDANSEFKTIRINKGSSHGIKLRSVVINSQGLIGYVYRLTNHYADILTILDQNNRVDALVDRTRSQGIVEGYSNGRCILKYVNRTEPIVLGDEVLTSGLGVLYPKGIRIGVISKIERESYGVTQFLELEPSVEFEKLEEVVILNSQENELLNNELKILDESKSVFGEGT